uniref:Uncharacterized protein LOC114340428 n=1 Tax=Diabrotica virgifera virgifera TaxID=50390 RepID=A0A6P7GLX5_DIAVI
MPILSKETTKLTEKLNKNDSNKEKTRIHPKNQWKPILQVLNETPPNTTLHQNSPLTSETPMPILSKETTKLTEKLNKNDSNKEKNENTPQKPMETDITSAKRNFSDANTPPAEVFAQPFTVLNTNPTKKPKTYNELEQLLEPAKIVFKEETLKLDFEQMVDFFENAYENKDLVSLVKTYTEDIDDFLKTLSKMHPYYADR